MATLADAIGAEWPAAFPDVRLSGDMIALLLALVDLETGTGASAWNWNLGNMVSTSDAQTWFYGYDSSNLRKFRAFESLGHGVVGFVKQVMSPTRPAWRDGLMSGDPTTFVKALGGVFGGPKYFEADLQRYLAAFLSRWDKYRGKYSSVAPVVGQSGGSTRAGSRSGAAVLVMTLAALAALAAVAVAGHR